MSFFFLSRSFFIDKENYLFVNIVSFELYCSIYCCIFCLFEKKREVPWNMSLFAKSVSLFKNMWKWNLNFQQTQNSWKIETYLIKRSSKCLKGFLCIECKLKLWCLTILRKSTWVGGGGSLNLEILRGGGSSSFGNSGGRGGGGQKTH